MQQNTFIPSRVHSYLFLPLQLTLSLLYTHTQLASSPALVSSHPRVRSRYSRRLARAKNLPARIPSRARSLLDSLSLLFGEIRGERRARMRTARCACSTEESIELPAFFRNRAVAKKLQQQSHACGNCSAQLRL